MLAEKCIKSIKNNLSKEYRKKGKGGGGGQIESAIGMRFEVDCLLFAKLKENMKIKLFCSHNFMCVYFENHVLTMRAICPM